MALCREFSRIQEGLDLSDVNSMPVRAASMVLEEYGWPCLWLSIFLHRSLLLWGWNFSGSLKSQGSDSLNHPSISLW